MQNVTYVLSPLPYEYDALEPYISSDILKLHHDKHHQVYVNGANKALEMLNSGRTEGKDIDTKAVMRDLSFNLNGHLLHEMYWSNMKPHKEDNSVNDELDQMFTDSFGSFEKFKQEFTNAGTSVEASGWVALLKDDSKNLLVMQIQNHNLLGINGFKPVLVSDVWEHAYYLDYKNDRGRYMENWWSVVNWDDVLERIKGK